MNISLLVTQMGILFFTIALGYSGAKLGVTNSETNRQISQIVIKLTLPCTILYSVLGSEHILQVQDVLVLTLVAFVSAGALILFAVILVHVLRIPAEQAGVVKFMLIFSNSAYIGFPVVRIFFGANAVFTAAIFNMAAYLLCYTYGIMLISGKRGKPGDWLQVLRTPIVISSVLAYILYLSKLRVPGLITDAFRFVDQATSPLSMLTIGFALAASPIRKMAGSWRGLAALGARMIVFPAIWFFLMRQFVHNPIILGVSTILVAMPAPAGTPMLCASYNNSNQTLASSGVLLSTLLSILTIPVIYTLVKG